MQIKRKMLILMAVSVGFFSSPLWAQTASKNKIELGNDHVQLSLSPKGEVLGIEDLVTHTMVLVSNNSGKAWRIDKTDKGEISNLDYDQPEIKQTSNFVVFTWKKTNLPTVAGQVFFDAKKEQFHFSATVRNQTKETLVNLSFPETLFFDDAQGNYLVVSSDQEFNTSLKPLNKLTPFTVMYPGYLFMQMAAFKIGDSSLLVYTDDDKAQVKWMSFKHENKKAQFNLSQRIWLKPGQSWKAPYSIVLKAISHGSYNEMAGEYAKWGRQQWWAQKKLTDKIARTPLLNRYFEGGLVRLTSGPPVCDSNSFRQTEDTQWHYIENNKYSKYEPYYESVTAWIPQYEKIYGIKPGYWFPTWSGHQFDTPYPDYFPVLKHMGNFDKFHKAIIENRWPIMYHMNIAHWPQTTKTAQITKYIAITDKGYNYRNIWCSWPKLNHVLTSPSVSLPVEMKTINLLKDKEGVNGIYLDVIGHAFATDDNPECKYFGEPNCYQLEKMEAFKTIRSAVTGPVMTEGRNEIELLYMDMGTGANGGPDVDEIPLWQMVYGDCAATTTYAIADKRLRYHTWMIGGVQNMRQDWPETSGKDLDIFLTAAQQKVISHVLTQRMERFDRIGECRVSQWANGVVVWNKAKTGQPVDIKCDTTLGKLVVNQLSPDGIVIVTNTRDFCADSVKSIQLNGKTLFSMESSVPVSITRADQRWVIHNEMKQPAPISFKLAEDWANTTLLKGKAVKTEEAITIQPVSNEKQVEIKTKVPAEDCLVIEDVKK
jgi:hypothetical protein